MSNAAVDVALHLRLHDAATPGLDRAAQRAIDGERRVAQAGVQARAQQAAAIDRTAQAAQRSVRDMTNATAQAHAQQRGSMERLSQARELLGVRSEHAVQREIKQTEAAYERLAKSGRLGAAEQSRAYDAMRQKVQLLTNEMGKLTAEQQRQAQFAERLAAAEARMAARAKAVQERDAKGQRVLQAGGMVVAGVAAGAYAMAAPVQRAMSFDERMAHMANTAFNERDTAGRRVGMRELEQAINVSVQRGGGTREHAAETLDALIASGAMRVDEAIKMLPTLTKAGTAANADPTQLAQIGIRAMQTFKVDAADLPRVLNMALAAGQAGGFELKDMAKWLPQQMAAATMSGMRGREGFAKLAALNQAAAITAGTKDEAGNNVVNLLAKINSQDTAKDAQKMGVNLPAYLQAQRAKGLDSVDAFAALVDRSVHGRDDYKALQRQLARAKTDDDKRAALESMTTIAQGAGIGKLIQDRQALMALLGMMNNREYLGEVLAKVRANDRGNGGAVDQNFELISGTGAYKQQQRQESMAAAEKAAIDKLPGGSAVNDALTSLAQRFPAVTGSASLAATGLAAVAGAAGIAALALRTQGAGGSAIARAAGKAVEYLPSGRTVAKVGAIGLGAAAGGAVLQKMAGEDSAIARYGSSMLNGAAAGATVGSLVPVVGTAIGAGVGASMGALYEWLSSKPAQANADKAEPPKMDAKVRIEFGQLPDGLVPRVAASSMSASGMNARFDTGNIMTGVPN